MHAYAVAPPAASLGAKAARVPRFPAKRPVACEALVDLRRYGANCRPHIGREPCRVLLVQIPVDTACSLSFLSPDAAARWYPCVYVSRCHCLQSSGAACCCRHVALCAHEICYPCCMSTSASTGACCAEPKRAWMRVFIGTSMESFECVRLAPSRSVLSHAASGLHPHGAC